jgi:hypothetical protein
MDRRRFLGLSLGSALAAALVRPGGAEADEGKPRAPGATADRVIVLWMNGGPSHLDTWDPKPGQKVAGPLKAIATRTPGVQISEHLPRLAERSQHLAILRGMSSREGNHDRARHLVHTGYAPTPTVAHPSLGGWVSEELGPASDLPAFVSIDGPAEGAGFLGVQHNPFVLKGAGKPPRDIKLPGGVNQARFERRQGLLERMETSFASSTRDPKVSGRREVYAHAVRLMRSPGLRAFDLAEESAATRAAYGDHDFGRGCLLARRLTESGVRVVEVALDGWDTHQDNFTRTSALCGTLDAGFGTLLDDLHARGTLGKTLVVCIGEFGRSPALNENEGRDHHPGAWSAVLAGGGVRGGVVHGQTDATGDTIVSGATTMPDLFATFARLIGLEPNHTLVTPLGRPISIVDDGGKPIAPVFAG